MAANVEAASAQSHVVLQLGKRLRFGLLCHDGARRYGLCGVGGLHGRLLSGGFDGGHFGGNKLGFLYWKCVCVCVKVRREIGGSRGRGQQVRGKC